MEISKNVKIFLPNCSQKHIIFSSNLQQIHKIAAFFTCNLWKWWYNKTRSRHAIVCTFSQEAGRKRNAGTKVSLQGGHW